MGSQTESNEFSCCVCMLRVIASSVDCKQFGASFQHSKSYQVVGFYFDS